MRIPDLPASRRALLSAAAGALAVGLVGCDTGGDEPGRPGGASAPPAEPDAVLLRAVLHDLATVAGLVAATVAAHPGLGGSLRALGEMHSDHHEVLIAAGEAQAPDAPTPQVPRQRRRALVGVLEAEAAHARRLGEAAAEAESGPFARVLAVLAAGVGQHVAALGPEPAR